MDTSTDFYCYVWKREDGSPYYIGKGKDNRYKKKRKGVNPPKDRSRIFFACEGVTESEAFEMEISLISLLGRKDLGTGILHNRTDGGEGSSGSVISEETKRKIGVANQNPSEKTRRKISEWKKGEKHPNFGKPLSESIKRKISESTKGEKNQSFGKKWWNDGCGNTKRSLECPGDGWKLGRK